VEAPSHHADEAGAAEIRESSSFFEDIFADDAPLVNDVPDVPVLAVDLDVDIMPAKPRSATTGKKKLRLKR
jgi:hypothetical protein